MSWLPTASILAAQPKIAPPKLTIDTARQDLAIEQIRDTMALTLQNISNSLERQNYATEALSKDYSKITHLIAQLSDKIENLDTKIDNILKDSNLLGTMASALINLPDEKLKEEPKVTRETIGKTSKKKKVNNQ